MRSMVLLMVLTVSVLAARAGEIDFATPLTGMDGQPLPDCAGTDCANKPSLTLGDIVLRVLTANFADEEKSLSGEDKFKRGELALRIFKNKKADLTAEEVALVKKLVGKAYGPLIVVRTWSLLDPAQK